MGHRDVLRKASALTLFAIAAAGAGSAGAQPTMPGASPLPQATPTPAITPAPTPSPSPTPAPTPTILMLPPDAPPQILWYQISSTTPHSGETVTGTVLASSNVASVEIRIGPISINMTKTDVGHFESSYRVPSIPFFVSHDFMLAIIARNTAGQAVQVSFPFQIR
jgi:hypothetical protein